MTPEDILVLLGSLLPGLLISSWWIFLLIIGRQRTVVIVCVETNHPALSTLIDVMSNRSYVGGIVLEQSCIFFFSKEHDANHFAVEIAQAIRNQSYSVGVGINLGKVRKKWHRSLDFYELGILISDDIDKAVVLAEQAMGENR